MSIKLKMILSYSFVVIFSVGIASIILGKVAFDQGAQSIEAQAQDKLIVLREEKKSQLDNYFNIIKGQILTYANSKMVIDAMRQFSTAFTRYPQQIGGTLAEKKKVLERYYQNEFGVTYKELNGGRSADTEALLNSLPAAGIDFQYTYIGNNAHPLGSKDALNMTSDGTEYNQLHAKYHPYIRAYLQQFGYYDIFLVDSKTGDIVYSVFKELDFATSLKTGPYAKTGIGRAFEEANRIQRPGEAVYLTDFQSYFPSYDSMASFIATPIFDGKRKVGVLIFQMPIDRINQVMTANEQWKSVGLGDSGETYLVGKDYKMRSQSRFLVEDKDQYLKVLRENLGVPEATLQTINEKDTSVGLQSVKTKAVDRALSGKSGFDVVTDYRGVPVLSAYAPVDILGLKWAILSEMDVSEAYEQEAVLRKRIIRSAIGVTVLLVLLGGGLGFLIARRFARHIEYAAHIADEISNGNLENHIHEHSKDELGVMLQALAKMQGNIKSQIDREKSVAQENVRVRIALENAAASILITDVSQQVIFCNKALLASFEQHYTEIRKECVSFSLDQLLGMDVTSLVGQQHFSEKQTMVRLAVGGITFDVTISPVKNEDNELLGYVTEWVDMSEALRQSKEKEKNEREEKERSEQNKHLIESVSHVLQAISEGDLSKVMEYEHPGEFKALTGYVNATVERLAEVIEQVRSASQAVDKNAQEIAESNALLQQQSDEQSYAIEETSSSMEEIVAMITQTSEQSKEVSRLSGEASTSAEHGERVIQETSGAMQRIKGSGDRINEIITMINEIAFQTNLLALNAAVEAARAGNHGRGFAVVASEVRSLAQRCADAAQEIQGLITETSDAITDGGELVEKASEVLADILGSSKEVTALMGEVSHAIQEQSLGAGQVKEAVLQIQNKTHANATLAGNMMTNSKSLKGEASSLVKLLNFFRIKS